VVFAHPTLMTKSPELGNPAYPFNAPHAHFWRRTAYGGAESYKS
jgi:hypothetical protein